MSGYIDLNEQDLHNPKGTMILNSWRYNYLEPLKVQLSWTPEGWPVLPARRRGHWQYMYAIVWADDK